MRTAARICIINVCLALLITLAFGASATAETVLYYKIATTAHPDPHTGSGAVDINVYINTYNSLLRPVVDPVEGLVPGPSVAASWEVSETGLVYTFHLRTDILFHDGGRLTAEDVVFSLERLLAMGQGFSFLFQNCLKAGGTVALDPYTVQMTLVQPSGPFLLQLSNLYIVSKAGILAHMKAGNYGDYGDYGADFLNSGKDCGSGAYWISAYTAGAFIEGTRFTDSWEEFVPNAPDKIYQTLVSDPVALQTMMKRRELDISKYNMTKEWYDAVDAFEGVDVVSVPANQEMYLQMNTQVPPLDDIHFRRALAWVFDYGTVQEEVFDVYQPSIGPVPRVLPGSDPSLFQFTYDLARAQDELRQSKYYGNLQQYMPLKFVWLGTLPHEETIGLIFKQDAALIGIDIELVKLPWAKIVEDCSSQATSPQLLLMYVQAAYPEAIATLYTKYHSAATGTWSQTEWLMDPEVDALIDAALKTSDRDARLALSRVVQQKIIELCPTIFTYDTRSIYAYQANIIDLSEVLRYPELAALGYFQEGRRIAVLPGKREEMQNR